MQIDANVLVGTGAEGGLEHNGCMRGTGKGRMHQLQPVCI